MARLNASLEGRYHVERELGEGGMATVYRADDLRHERKVALKVLKPELAAALGAERFLAEIKTTANLQHPHILPLFDSGEADSLLFYVMPYVEGESLRDRLDREGRFAVDDAIRIVTLIASALEYSHARGIVHRDIKPANIMLSGGLPVVTDFGVALAIQNAGDVRLTGTGMSLGTPLYASPEQATGDSPVDSRSDLYSLGCVLYELLAGHPPHPARTTQAIVAKRLTVAPTPVRALRPTVPEHVDVALGRALAIDPAQRYQAAGEFSRALQGSKERAELYDRLDDVAGGKGTLVLLGGEPGVGKTRLSESVLEEARRRGFMCVVGHSYEAEGTPPFAPFIEQLEYTARVVPPESFRAALGDAAPEIARIMPALRSQFNDIGEGIELPPDQFRHYLFFRYSEFLARACGIAPLVVLFEDLHWADESSLLLIEHLAQRLHGMAVLAIGTYRAAELDVGRPLAASLERLAPQRNVNRMALKPLPREEIHELLEVLGGSPPPDPLLETISNVTEGNPFFVQEVFRHLSEEGRLFDDEGRWRKDLTAKELDVPEGVRLVVGRRLERVSDNCRKALTTAAVIGRRFPLNVLEAVRVVDEDALLDALDEAEAAQLIHAVRGHRNPVYGFTHELIRQTLIDTMSIPRRQRQHTRIAAALSEVHGRNVEKHASEMAHHLYQAGAAADLADVLRFLRLAGDQAVNGSGYEEALAQYQRALSLEEEVPPELVPVLLEGSVNALDGMGRWADVIEVGQQALKLYQSMNDADGLARVARLVSYRLDWRAQAEGPGRRRARPGERPRRPRVHRRGRRRG
jgi:tRNA A-37 threonylcarbamoyl transferase component Bud32